MPKVKVNSITLNYEQQGSGEPLLLIPYLTADHMCYAFQVAEYAKHFTCISIDLRGTGESDKPPGKYTTELLADEVAAFLQAIGVPAAHVSGLSLGAAVGLWLGAKYPAKVKSLSLHSPWPKTDPFLIAVAEGWRTLAQALNSVPEMVIQAIFPWCLTPELYAARPDYIQSLVAFVRSRPAQPLPSFLEQSNAVLKHDVEARLGDITAPTLLSFGRHDRLTSLRFADRLKSGIRNSDLLVFENSAHTPIYEQVEEFNAQTFEFLKRHAGGATPAHAS